MGHLFRMPRPSGHGQSMGYTCTPVKIKETGVDTKLWSMKYYVDSLASICANTARDVSASEPEFTHGVHLYPRLSTVYAALFDPTPD